jgi:hypothetical protein
MVPESCYSPWGLVHYYLSSLSDPTLGSTICPIICKEALETMSEIPPNVTLGAYLVIFGLTCLLESPFYFWTVRDKQQKGKALLKSGLGSVLLCNLATHPAVYFLFPLFGANFALRYVDVLMLAEIFAPIVEALVLILVWKISWKRAFIGMVAANLFSWWVGIYWV